MFMCICVHMCLRRLENVEERCFYTGHDEHWVGVIFNFPLLAGKSAVLIRKMLGLISSPPQIMKIK